MDIFPLDGFPTGDLQTKIHLMRIKMLRSLVNAEVRQKFLKNEKFRLIKLLLRKLFRKSGNHYAQRLNVVAKKYKFESCQYVGVKTTTVHLFREKNPKSIYSETVYLPFEHLFLPVPVGYNKYLTHLYGDYMQLPPENERHSKHEFVNLEYNLEGGKITCPVLNM